MFGVVREYSVEASELERLVARIVADFVPLITRTLGFAAYSIATNDKGELVTTSLYSDRVGARASTKLAAEWTEKHAAKVMQAPAYVSEGELLLVERAANSERPAYGVMRRYHFRPSDVPEILTQVRTNLVPVITRSEGFSSYVVIDAGQGEIVSLTSFSDKQSSDETSVRALAWIKEYLSRYGLPPKVSTGRIRFRYVDEAAFAVASVR
jgi:hypothetical protein